jgi:Terminase large subunit, T4likevirus-type, N-terminal/Terminase RNaseH-like domain
MTAKKDGYLGNPNLKPVGVQQQFTPEQVKEYIKCATDPVHFVEKYVKIVAVDKGLVPFEMYDFQKDLIDKLHGNRFVIGKLPRQVGKTTTVGAYLLHYVLFNQNMNVAILANKQSTAIEILGRIKMAYEYLPKWLQQGVIEWNKGSIVLENGSRILAAATSSSAIRGGSFNCILLDEFAHIPTQIAEEFFTSVYPTITSGQSTKMFIISTPNGLNMFYYYWKGAINNQNGYVPFEVHWSQVPKYPGGPLRDDQWKREMISKTSEKQFEQEFECDFLGSSNTLISADKLHTLVYSKPVLRTKDGMSIYQEPIRKDSDNEKSHDHLYFITADVAEGQGKDYTAMTVIDVTKFPYRVVAAYRNNTVSPLLFASVVKTVAKKYNNAYVLIEVNSIGTEVANILHTDLEYENIVKTAMMGRKGQIITEGYGPVKKVQMGVKTSVLTKKIGCQVLKNLIEEDKLIVEDADIISEFTTFISKKQSFEAEDGHNDDLVMCLVLFSWATRQQYFKNLTDMDVRLAMYQQEIDKIEDDMLPFGYYQSGIEEDDESDQEINWASKHEKWIITDKQDFKIPWDSLKINGRVI